MNFVIIIAALVAATVVGGFFFLAQKSKAGSPPGIVEGRLTPCPDKANCVTSEPAAPEARSVGPFPVGSWPALPEAIKAEGGEVSTVRDDYIAATFSSSVFGFVDDVEFRRAEDAVHVRSASRVGYSDAGANRKRVERLHSRIESAIKS